MKRDRCKHFNGLMNDVCDAGVVYETVMDRDGKGLKQRIPCLGELPCEKKELPTAEEIAADEAAMKARTERTLRARRAIIEHAMESDRDRDAIPCPVCRTGTLKYAIHSNGHVHAACSTEDCVCWME